MTSMTSINMVMKKSTHIYGRQTILYISHMYVKTIIMYIDIL